MRSGQTTAAARAKCAALRVHVVAEEAVGATLVRVAEVALAFGPSVAFDIAQDVVWVEIGGCAHLQGGERELAQKLEERVRALGHACRVAIADGPRVAAAVARFATARRRGPFVVPEGEGASAMRVLPVAALALENDVMAWLAALGLRTCGDLQMLPRRALGTRLGAHARSVIKLLDGDDGAPLDAWHLPQVPEEHIELEWGASSVETLAFVTKTLCDRLAARLEGRAMAAARIELVLTLDRALCEGASRVSTLEVALPTPLGRAADLLAVVRARLERHVLAAPVLSATLRAPELARISQHTLNLLAPEPKADRALPRLVAELTADLGGANVGTLGLVDVWAPDERTKLLPLGSIALQGLPTSKNRSREDSDERSLPHALMTSAIEPSRLVDRVCVPREYLVDGELLMRIEAVDWWHHGTARRDLLSVWIPERGALAWVDLQDDRAWIRGWID
jgi:protein ImuB